MNRRWRSITEELTGDSLSKIESKGWNKIVQVLRNKQEIVKANIGNISSYLEWTWDGLDSPGLITHLSSWWLFSFSASMRLPNIRLLRESSSALDTSAGSLNVMIATRRELARVLILTALTEQPPLLYSRWSSSFSLPSERSIIISPGATDPAPGVRRL